MSGHIANTPILILGMHRSGTTLLTRALKEFGLFLGIDVDDATHESNFYIRFNDLLLSQVASSWSATHAIDALSASEETTRLFTEYYRVLKTGWRYSDYFGKYRFLRRKLGSETGGLWGWKDPRNCLTLPFWLRVYPGLRVINIQRHGTDVALSLLRRNREMTASAVGNFERRKWIYNFRYRRTAFPYSVFLSDFSQAIGLWDFYQQRAELALQARSVNAYTIRYERFLEQPKDVLVELLDYLGVAHQRDALSRFSDQIDSSRKFAYLADPTAVEQSRAHELILVRHGYSAKGYA